MDSNMKVINADGNPDPNQPKEGEYKLFITAPDTLTMLWTLNELQKIAFLSNNFMYRYDEWIDQVVDRVQKG